MEYAQMNVSRDSCWMWMVYAIGVHTMKLVGMVDVSVWRTINESMVDVSWCVGRVSS